MFDPGLARWYAPWARQPVWGLGSHRQHPPRPSRRPDGDHQEAAQANALTQQRPVAGQLLILRAGATGDGSAHKQEQHTAAGTLAQQRPVAGQLLVLQAGAAMGRAAIRQGKARLSRHCKEAPSKQGKRAPHKLRQSPGPQITLTPLESAAACRRPEAHRFNLKGLQLLSVTTGWLSRADAPAPKEAKRTAASSPAGLLLSWPPSLQKP